MAHFDLPFGHGTLPLDVEDKNLAGVLTSSLASYTPALTGEALIEKALEAPVGSPRLSELSVGKKKIVIIASDHTRPVPSKVLMPPMLREIRKGNPNAEITLLIATGLHRSTKLEELEAKFGAEIVKNEKIFIHDCDDSENLVKIGTLPSGGDLIINRLAAEADLLVSEGFIEPHFFAGFSGGRKSVLPGIASRSTVLYNHNSDFIASDAARTGKLDGNPIHADMLYAGKTAKLAFIVNVVINAAHEPVYAVAGDVEKAHAEGCRFLNSFCRASATPADIAVSTNGGAPLDQNIYQSVKGMTAAEATVKKGGVIIMLASASDGHGGESFHKTFRDSVSIETLMRSFLVRPRTETIVDQWESQILARILLKATVIYVSTCPDELIREMHMIPAHTPNEALALAASILKKPDTKVAVIPDGVSVIVD